MTVEQAAELSLTTMSRAKYPSAINAGPESTVSSSLGHMLGPDPNRDDRERFVCSIESTPWLLDLAESEPYTNSMALLADDPVLVFLDGSYGDSWVLAIQTGESPEDAEGLVVLGLQLREMTESIHTAEMPDNDECSLTDSLTAAQLITLAERCRTLKFVQPPLARDHRPFDAAACPSPVWVWVWDLVLEPPPKNEPAADRTNPR